MTGMGRKIDQLLEVIGSCKIYDLEQPRSHDMPISPSAPPGFSYFLVNQHENLYNQNKEGPRSFSTGLVIMSDHTGTHIDSLCHIASNLDCSPEFQ